METTKIQLSEDELLLMRNSDWILTKNRIIDKVNLGLGGLAIQMQERLSVRRLYLDENITLFNPKISRGEKYKGLPYLILDYPRIFGKDDILAIRTLFWWGHYCSITLHLKGVWQQSFIQKIIALTRQHKLPHFYISFSGDEWSHDLSEPDYTELKKLAAGELSQKLSETSFVKLAAKTEIEPWDIMQEKLFRLFLILAELIDS